MKPRPAVMRRYGRPTKRPQAVHDLVVDADGEHSLCGRTTEGSWDEVKGPVTCQWCIDLRKPRAARSGG